MHFRAIQHITGILLMIFSIALLPPVFMDLWFKENIAHVFFSGYVSLLVTGLILWLPTRKYKPELRLREGFLVVALFWIVLSLAGAVPLILYDHEHITLASAVFESVSALTTSGGTVLIGLDSFPKAILFYRSELQFLGGMGIIVLAVAILPMLGIGGMQLYRAEAPGPVKDTKLTPRITETAKALWYIYLTLNIACISAYWFAGMAFFDAVNHGFTTMSLGGLSTHDDSIGYFNNPVIESISVFFMLVGGVNFALHFVVFRKWRISSYFADSEFKTYIFILSFVSAICILFLYFSGLDSDLYLAIRHGIFHTVSLGTTTGFTTTAFYQWPGFLPTLLIFITFIGGCAGSTGGGMKVIRVLLLLKQGAREMFRLIHPRAQVAVKVDNKPVPDSVIDAVWGFFAAYVAAFVVMMLLLMASGLDQVTAFSAVASCINNAGASLGGVGSNYAGISEFAKWVLSFAMVLGRLEVFTLLVLFMPAFWRK